MKKRDLTGQRFGRLTVIEEEPIRIHNRIKWSCRCDCGNVTSVYGCHLTTGQSTSCGCFNKEQTSKANLKHGMRNERLYNIWSHMKARCSNEKTAQYADYGGRGIKVCDEWLSFKSFSEWALNNGYRDDLTIDRIDVDKGYSPDNCRWANIEQQANNKRNTAYITVDGVKMSIADWQRRIGKNTLYARKHMGHTEEQLIKYIKEQIKGD